MSGQSGRAHLVQCRITWSWSETRPAWRRLRSSGMRHRLGRPVGPRPSTVPFVHTAETAPTSGRGAEDFMKATAFTGINKINQPR